ncbi:MAG: type II toxin-antitoxin system HicA family toxin [Lachnospira sp.]|nr:type II toxin-antitoxin system HicA family toxin [Lachnospira sp.]
MMVFKDIDKILRANDWYKVRVNSSHNIYKHEGFTISLSVPNHGKISISTGVVKSLERATGLSFR